MNPRHFVDQIGRSLTLNGIPQRIVSLVPSQTELICDLGASDRLCGVTAFCIHPGNITSGIRKIGGTKQFRFELIDSLQPDLIIGNKEENYPEGIKRLAEKYPVWMSDIISLQDAENMIAEIGKMLDLQPNAQNIISRISESFATLRQTQINQKQIRTAYLIWKDPWMAAAGGTFIDTMLQAAGMSNVFAGQNRYPEFSLDELKALNPEWILLSSEPYAFNQTHLQELQLQFPDARITLVNGEYFSWYGSRLLKSAEYFRNLRNEQGL